MKKLIQLVSLSTCLFSLNLLSSSVDETLITQFQAGDAASAADVNQNFQALIDAINDNAAQLQEIKDTIATLPGTFLLPKQSLEADITGSSYKVFSHENGIGTSSRSNPVQNGFIVKHSFQELLHTLYSESATLTLNNDGTFDFTFANLERELLASTFAEHDIDSPDFARVARVTYANNYNDSEAETLNGTWSLNGQVLDITFPADGEDEAETISLNISPDGNVVMLGSIELDTFPGINVEVFRSLVVMGVRSYHPEPDVNIQIDNTGNFPARIDAVNNGTPFRLFNAAAGAQDTKRIYIENTGDADLVVGSIALIQDPGDGFGIDELIGTITITPGMEEIIEISSMVPLMNEPNFSDVYVFTNDPDTPTFIVKIWSESASGVDNSGGGL